MKLNTIISSTAALLIGATAAFAMESKPAEPRMDPTKTEYMETQAKTAQSVLVDNALGQVSSLNKSFKGNSEATGLIDKAMSAFKGGNDIAGVAALNKLSGIKMTDGQTQLVNEFKQSASAYALGQSFDTSDPAISGPVNNAIAAVRTGDHLNAAKSLQEVYQLSSISPEQKQLLTEVMLQYKGVDVDGLKNAAGAASGAMKRINNQ